MDLATKLSADLKEAQLAHNELKVSTLRLLLSEIHNGEIQAGQALDNDKIITVIQREAKKRSEAAEAFQKAGRIEAGEKEKNELKILQVYLPEQLSTEELTGLVKETITEVGATSVADMGKVMNAIMAKVAGQADGSSVSVLVKEQLS